MEGALDAGSWLNRLKKKNTRNSFLFFFSLIPGHIVLEDSNYLSW